MRTLVDIPDHQIDALRTLCATKNLSRAELIRRALTDFIEANKVVPESAFGLWATNKIDGLDYQERVRSEW